MSENKDNMTPDISIDQAVEMFINLNYPNGLPDGIEKDNLVELMKRRIAEDRPDWAEKHKPVQPKKSETSQSQNQERNYLKKYQERAEKIREIIEASKTAYIPEDPEFRYLYERAQTAMENLEIKKREEEDEQEKERLRQRILSKGKDSNEVDLEKAFEIKQKLNEVLLKSIEENTIQSLNKLDFTHAKLQLGTNSIVYTEILKKLEDKYDVELTRDENLDNSIAIDEEIQIPSKTDKFDLSENANLEDTMVLDQKPVDQHRKSDDFQSNLVSIDQKRSIMKDEYERELQIKIDALRQYNENRLKLMKPKESNFVSRFHTTEFSSNTLKTRKQILKENRQFISQLELRRVHQAKKKGEDELDSRNQKSQSKTDKFSNELMRNRKNLMSSSEIDIQLNSSDVDSVLFDVDEDTMDLSQSKEDVVLNPDNQLNMDFNWSTSQNKDEFDVDV